MLINLSAAVSGMPSSNWPFPGTTKNTHLFLIILNLITTVHMPNCIMNIYYLLIKTTENLIALNDCRQLADACIDVLADGTQMCYKMDKLQMAVQKGQGL